MLSRQNAQSTTVLLSFEAPDRSAFQAWRGNLLENFRRGFENRMLETLHVVEYLSQVWDESAPHVGRAAGKVTSIVTNRVVTRWALAWTLAAVWLCY